MCNCVYMCSSMSMNAGTLENHQRMSSSLDLEFQMVVRQPKWVLGTQPVSSAKTLCVCSYLLRHLSSPRYPKVVFSFFDLVEAGSPVVGSVTQADFLPQPPLLGLHMHTRASSLYTRVSETELRLTSLHLNPVSHPAHPVADL